MGRNRSHHLSVQIALVTPSVEDRVQNHLSNLAFAYLLGLSLTTLTWAPAHLPTHLDLDEPTHRSCTALGISSSSEPSPLFLSQALPVKVPRATGSWDIQEELVRGDFESWEARKSPLKSARLRPQAKPPGKRQDTSCCASREVVRAECRCHQDTEKGRCLKEPGTKRTWKEPIITREPAICQEL